MDPFDLLFVKPGHQLAPAFERIAKTFGARACLGPRIHICYYKTLNNVTD
jgi:hypothetical protein